jgi:hypothetical protein
MARMRNVINEIIEKVISANGVAKVINQCENQWRNNQRLRNTAILAKKSLMSKSETRRKQRK